jgi:hypothetical protein
MLGKGMEVFSKEYGSNPGHVFLGTGRTPRGRCGESSPYDLISGQWGFGFKIRFY